MSEGVYRVAAILLALSLMALVAGGVSAQIQPQVVIKVSDPLGDPVANAEVLLIRGSERFRFLTNSTGHAIFFNVPEGVFEVSVRIGGVRVAEGTLSFPETRYLELTAKIARVNFTLLNMAGDPVKGASLTLLSATGAYNSSSTSDESGNIALKPVPYSSLEEIGGYVLEVRWGELKVLERELEVSEPLLALNLTLPLLNLNVTVTDLEGEAVDRARVTLSTGDLRFSESVSRGVASFENIPSSELEGVGEYFLNVSLRTKAGDMLVHSERRVLARPQELYVVAELAKLEVRVLDEDGEPVKGVYVQLSNELLANFTRVLVNINGTAYFRNVPTSGGSVPAGDYRVEVIRRDKVIGVAAGQVEKSREVLEVRVSRATVNLRLRDYEGSPLPGYKVVLRDEEAGEEYEAVTGADGSASLKLFLGPYYMEVLKDGRVMYRGMVDVEGAVVEVEVASANFPYTLEFRDSFGAPLRAALLKLYLDGELLYEGVAEGLPITLKLPWPGKLQVDIYSPEGELIHRSTFWAERPGRATVRLSSYALLGGGLVALEDIGFSASLVAVAAVIACSGLMAYRSARSRRQS